MVVYIEYAIVENFILDGLLLYAAFRISRVPIVPWRFFLATAIGTAFAVLFPLFTLPSPTDSVLKISFGGILCLVASPANTGRKIFSLIALFYASAFALGGGIWAIRSFTDVPVWTVVSGALLLVGIAEWLQRSLYRRARVERLRYRLRIETAAGAVETHGLLDTGNLLTFRGKPVCLLDEALAKRLFPDGKEEGRMFVHTALSEGEVKIFKAKTEIYSGGKQNIIDKTYFAVVPVGNGRDYGVVLSPQAVKEGKDVS